MRLAALILAFWPVIAPAQPTVWQDAWPITDFSRSAVTDWAEVMSGGPPRDGIPALVDPVFLPVAAETRLVPREPVITLEMAGQVPRAYPLRYLMWHEIVNDNLGDMPVAVTYCPLCNSGMVFDRRTAAGVLEFGVSGLLRHSDMIMYDRQTDSWWQQAVGQAIVGELTGTELQSLPAWMESWGVFVARNPEGLVMDQPGYPRDYGANPYVRYDSAAQPFLYDGEVPPHGIAPLARVIRVGAQAWPLTRLAAAGVLVEEGLTLTWTGGMASALDTARIADGADTGMVRVQDAAGTDLVHDTIFAFVFHAFWPDGEWMLGN